MLARCPSCRETFSTASAGLQDCPACHKPLFVPAPPAGAVPPVGQPSAGPVVPQASAPGAALPVPPPAGDDARGTPWERRAELGTLRAWRETVAQALLEPGKLFAAARLDQGGAQLRFAVLTGSVFWAIEQILDRALFSGRQEQLLRILRERDLPLGPLAKQLLGASVLSWPKTLLLTLFAPVFVYLLLYANAGVTHGAGLLTGQAKRGFPATFAAAAYACAPLVFLAVPGCGSFIALAWTIVLTGVGMKELHRTTPGGALLAVLAPYFVLCCAGCALAVVAGTLLRGGGGMVLPE